MSDTCPTCGGPCEAIPVDAEFSWESYESLVKGEVVAAKAVREIKAFATLAAAHAPGRAALEEIVKLADAALEAGQKEDSVIQERTGR